MRSNVLKQFFSRRYVPPFRHTLPGEMAEMVARESPKRKLAADFMLLKRWLLLSLAGQSRLLTDQLPPAPARLLWIRNPKSASIGDSVMELAGRTMLGGYDVDLLTHKGTDELFQTDRYFKNILTEPGAVDARRYDFVLLDLFNTNSIKLKSRICASIPFAGLQGFFYGSNYHHMLFSCYRIHHLLGYPYSDRELAAFLKPTLFLKDEPLPLPPKNRLRVCLMVGGVNPIKTYRLWPEVMKLLRQGWPTGRPFPELVLIGSANGHAYVEQVMAVLDQDQPVSLVGKLSLRATARLLADCDFFIGPDGGLMHCALGFGVPGLALFALFKPRLYLPPETKMQALYDLENINNIDPQLVAKKVQELLGVATRCFG
jgi:ADP-heptose:LPS heptosyltransferase